MQSSRRMVVSGAMLVATALVALIAMLAPDLAARAARISGPGPQQLHRTHILRKGPVKLAMSTSRPLFRPVNPPRLITIPNGLTQNTTPNATAQPAAATCPAPTLDLKVLVLATDGNEADLPAIQQALDYLGTPYTVYLAAKTPNGLTPDKLSNGCHGYYQGIILTNGDLGYANGSAWVSALTQQEWTNLWTYEATMGVRELSWYTYPTADYGYQAPGGVINTSTTTLPVKLTAQGQATFTYLNSGTTIPIQDAYTYLAKPLTDGTTTALLNDVNGNALALVRVYPDGRQALSLTFDSNPNLTHSIVLSYGLINWLTSGLFLGERHIYMSPQIDDVFIDDSDWQVSTACGTPVDNTGFTYRITGADFLAVNNWQQRKRINTMTSNLTLTMAFNGFGTTQGAYTPDTLTPTAAIEQGQFYWVSHTYDHLNLDNVDYATATSEITQNNQVAANLHLTHFSTSNMVTPDVSGLTNPNYLQAAFDQGIRHLVTDTSLPGYGNPSPNAGIYNSLQPQILMLPRRPNNLFYNVSTPAGWTAEYNCIYHNFWGRNLSYQEILDVESQTLVTYMLKGDLDPWMFHQPNLRAYDGVHTLLGDLLDQAIQKYAQYYNLSVMAPTMDVLAQTVANRMQYNGAGVTASIRPGVSITLTTQKAARVPVTGLRSNGAQNYGGQPISYITLAAGQSVTLPLL